MPVNPDAIGRKLPPISMDIERGRLAAFARATGSTDAVYFDLDAARRAGHRDLPVPPTFLMAIELEDPDPFSWIRELGIDMNYVLHGSQNYTYQRLAYAGEHLTATSTITDVFSKKGGALEFVVKETAVTDESGGAVAVLTQTIVVRNPGVKA